MRGDNIWIRSANEQPMPGVDSNAKSKEGSYTHDLYMHLQPMLSFVALTFKSQRQHNKGFKEKRG